MGRFLDTQVKHYSSGMFVRLGFAVAAHLETEILIVDEVLAVGDAGFQRKCLGKMKDAAETGRTVLFVSHNMAFVRQLCTRALVLHEVTFRELYEAAMALQLATIEAATRRATPEQIDAMQENIDRTARVLEDPAAVAKLDAEFHRLIGRASANRVLQLAREPTDLLVRPTTELVLRASAVGAARLLEAHRRLLEAIRAHDADLGRLWARRHIADWRKGFERAGNDLDQPIDRIFLQAGRLPVAAG